MGPSLVLLPVLLIWGFVLAVYLRGARRDGRPPVDDVGFMFLVVLILYATLPPLSWLYQGGTYTSMYAGRLLTMQPSTEETLYPILIALGYTGGFAAIYLAFAKKVPQPLMPREIPRIRGALLAGSVVVAASSMVSERILLVVGGAGIADSYLDTYRALADMSLETLQLLKLVNGFGAVAKLVVLTGLLQRWPKHRGWFALYVLSVLGAYDPSGSRAAVAVSLLAIVVTWHTNVRAIAPWRWFAMFAGGIVAFLALGFWRELASWDGIAQLDASDFALGEFDALWANGIELARSRQLGAFDVPPAAYFGEFVSFIPSQLLPFEKMSLSEWYMYTFHAEYKLAGGGWVFGAIAQAVIGAGIPEAIVRGAMLGGVALLLIRWQRRPNGAWWNYPVYLYILISCFQTFRNTTFYLLNDTIQIILPSIGLISIASTTLARRTKIRNLNAATDP